MLTRLAVHARRNAVAYLALFVALGGTTYAASALPTNSVGTKQLKNGAVTGKKVKHGSLTGADLRAATINAAHAHNSDRLGGSPASAFLSGTAGISGGDLTGTYAHPVIASNAVTGSKVAPNSLTGANIDESTLSGIGSGVVSGRINGLDGSEAGGPPSGTSTAAPSPSISIDHESPSVDLVARDFSLRLTSAPGAGNSRAMYMEIATTPGVWSGYPICTIQNTATTCTSAGPISIPAGSSYEIDNGLIAGSPSSADLLFGYRLTTP